MVDDELPAAVEEVFEALLSFRAVEGVGLFDLHHGEAASLGVHSGAVLGDILLMLQKFLSLGEPFVARSDRWM
jgi:hypothetical protein